MHSSIGCTLFFSRLFKQKFASTPYFLVQGSRPVSVSRLPDSLSIAPVMNTTMSFDELKMPVIVNKKPRVPIHNHWHLHRVPQRHLRYSCKKIFTARVTVRHGPDNVSKQGNRDITPPKYSTALVSYSLGYGQAVLFCIQVRSLKRNPVHQCSYGHGSLTKPRSS